MADNKCNLAKNTFLVYLRFLVFSLLLFRFFPPFFVTLSLRVCPAECVCGVALNVKLGKLSKNILIQLETNCGISLSLYHCS